MHITVLFLYIQSKIGRPNLLSRPAGHESFPVHRVNFRIARVISLRPKEGLSVDPVVVEEPAPVSSSYSQRWQHIQGHITVNILRVLLSQRMHGRIQLLQRPASLQFRRNTVHLLVRGCNLTNSSTTSNNYHPLDTRPYRNMVNEATGTYTSKSPWPHDPRPPAP